jgi:hypothetical protein
MTIIKAKGIHTTAASFLAEGSEVFARATRDGALFTADWYMAQALAGNVFGINAGVLTSPVSTTTGGLVDGTQDVLINVPSGTTIIPIRIGANFEDTGTADVLEVLAVASAVYDNANTSTAITIMSMRSDKPKGSACSAMYVVSADGTAVESGNFVEFWRPYAGSVEDAFASSTGFKNQYVHGSFWNAKTAVVPPIITGPGSLSLYAAGQAATGFFTVIWVELPTAALTSD